MLLRKFYLESFRSEKLLKFLVSNVLQLVSTANDILLVVYFLPKKWSVHNIPVKLFQPNLKMIWPSTCKAVSQLTTAWLRLKHENWHIHLQLRTKLLCRVVGQTKSLHRKIGWVDLWNETNHCQSESQRRLARRGPLVSINRSCRFSTTSYLKFVADITSKHTKFTMPTRVGIKPWCSRPM